MATKKEINKQLLKEATEKYGADYVQNKIKDAGLQKIAIKTLQTPDPVVEPVEPVKPVNEMTATRNIATESNNIQELEREQLRKEREQEQETSKTTNINIAPKTPDIPKVETKTTPEIKPKVLPTSIEEWKTQGSNMADLETMIEQSYGTVATNENGVLTANIEGVNYQWNIDDAGNPIKTKAGGESAKDIFNQLLTGQEFPDTGIKTTPEYKTAKKLYNKYEKYQNYTESDFKVALSNGELIPGTQLYKFLNLNPEIKLKIDRANSVNIINEENEIDTDNAGQNLTEEVVNDNTISNYMSDNNISIDEFNAMTSSEESIAKGKEVETYELKVNELQSTYDNIRTETEKEFKGTGASKTAVEALIARRQADIRPALNLAIANRNTAYGTYTDMKNTAIDLFKTNLGLYQTQQSAQAKQNALVEQRQFDYAMLQDKRAYEQANAGVKTEMITDPATGKKALINSVTGEIIQSYETGLKSEQMSEYQKAQLDMQLQKMDLESQKYNIEMGKLTKLDDGTYQDGAGNIITQEEINQQKLLNNKYLNLEEGDNAGVECGVFASRGTGMTATPGGNSLTERIQEFNENTPTVGGMVLFNGGEYNKTYGHIAVVTGISDGTITIKESNLNGDNVVTERTIPLEGSNISGFYNKTPLVGGGETEGVSQSAQNWGQNILRGIGGAKLSSIKDEDLRNEVSNYLATAKIDLKPGDKIYDNIQSQIDALEGIVDWPEGGTPFIGNDTVNESLAEDVSGSKFLPSPFDSLTGEREQFLTNIQFILDGEILENLIDVKSRGATFGALSDKEGAILQRSASLLNAAAIKSGENITRFKMSEKDFKHNLTELLRTLKLSLKPENEDTTTGGNTITSSTGKEFTEQELLNKLN